MIKYRPHRGNLEEAMKESKTFQTLDEMYEYILSDWSVPGGKAMFSKDDLSIGEDLGPDRRTGWKETRYVCTRRMGDKCYDEPQCIGMCSMEGE